MDPFMGNHMGNHEQRHKIETRWDRIEKRHINSAQIFDHTNSTATEICENLIQNHEFITGDQLKVMIGEKSKQSCINPNLLMDLRHSRVKRRHKSASQASRRHNKVEVNERLHYQKMTELNREIQKFKKSLENIRPKTKEFKNIGIVKPSISIHSLSDSRSIDGSNRTISDFSGENSEKSSPHSLLPILNDTIQNNIQCQHKTMNEHQVSIEAENNEAAMSLLRLPASIASECLPTVENCATNDIEMKSFMHDNYTFSESGSISPCSSTQTELRTVIRQQLNDDFEFIITPTIMLNVQDTIQSNFQQDFNDTRSAFNSTSPCFFHRESKVAVNQHMSILIKKLTNEVVAEKSVNDSSGLSDNEQIERNDIINEVLDNKSHDNFMLLQRYFLQWVHFTTIEKLRRRNPAQSRLQKMEAFLQNITRERKRALNKLRRPGNIIVVSRRDDNERQSKLHGSHMESPRFLTRTYNNKLKVQQDIIELQKIKLQRQQRIITELKLSKLLDDTNEAENHLRDELGLVSKYGCAKSRSKAKCLQIAGNLKTEDADVQSELQAKGIKAPKFLIEMQARALERQLRHEEAQRRREAYDREKEALRIAAEEEKRLLDEETKRQRIKEFWRKRREEKELEAKKALERMKFLADLEKAKAFYRERLLKQAMKKFRNVVQWKIRNKKVCTEMRRRIILRNIFMKWRQHTVRVWEERKERAISFDNRRCLKMAWSRWQQEYLILQSKQMVADDWFHLRLSERVFQAWERITAQTRLIFEIKQRQADAHFNWYLKWKALEHWRRLHAILKIEKETEARRERWRSKVYELIPDYTPNTEFI